MKRRSRSLRIGGIGRPPRAGADDVAAATRLKVRPLLPAPTPSSAALLGLPDAFPRAQRRRSPLCSRANDLLPCRLRLSPPVNISTERFRATDDEDLLPLIIIFNVLIGGARGCSYISTSPSLWRGADHVAIQARLLQHLLQLSLRGRCGPQQPWYGANGCRTVISRGRLYSLSMPVFDGSIAHGERVGQICLLRCDLCRYDRV